MLAQATREERLVLQVAAAAAKGRWRASAWLLERRFAQRWAERRRVEKFEVDHPPGAMDELFAEVDDLARRRRERHWRR
jgi:hypothetical protein